MTESDKAVMQRALDSKNRSAKAGQKEAAVAFVTYDGSTVDLNELARYVVRLEYAIGNAIAQPTQEPNAWRVSGTNRLYDQHEAQQEARRCGGSARAYPVYAEPKPVEPANDKLLQIIAAAYQIAGACDLPFHILDVLANPEKATQEQIDAMLPFVRTEQQKETK